MSRIFASTTEAINEIERDIMEMGIKVQPHTMQNKYVKGNDDYETKEVQNYSFNILNMSDKDSTLDEQNLQWVKEEFAERIDTVGFVNPGKAWKTRGNTWQEFLNDEGEMDYTYNERMNALDQINLVIAELKDNPDSRQCLIHVNFPGDCLFWQEKRIPCSVYYQLMIRRGKLDIIYNMRSSDFYSHFKNDMWLADELRNHIAKEVGIKPGLFMMNVGSLHVYKNYGHKGKHVF